MEILKSKKDRQGDFSNRYVPANEQKVVSIDKLVEQSKANRLAANSHDFKEWRDPDGNIFDTYVKLLDYQTDKFIKRYPPNFAISIRPELVIIAGEKMSWNKQGIRILITDNDQWYFFIRNLQMLILQWGGYNGIISDSEAPQELERILNEFAIKLNNLISENNTEN